MSDHVRTKMTDHLRRRIQLATVERVELFRCMAERHTEALRRWALARGSSSADAADLVQEVFEKALKTQPLVRNDTELRAWLMTVLRNLHIDSKRSIAVRYSIPCDSLPLSAPEPEATPLWRQIDVEVLYATLPRLSPPMRRAFELRLAGHGMRQIARQLGIAEATVGVRLHRARRVLKKLILVHYLRESAAEGRRPPQGFVPSIVAPSNDVYQEPPEVRTQGMMTRRAVSAKRTE